MQPDSTTAIGHQRRIVVKTHAQKGHQRGGTEAIEPASCADPDRALPILQDRMGLAVGQAVFRFEILMTLSRRTWMLNPGEATELIGKPDASLFVHHQNGDTRDTHCVRALIFTERPHVIPGIADPHRAVGKLDKLIDNPGSNRDLRKGCCAALQLVDMPLVRGPEIVIAIEEHRVKPVGG